MQPAGLDGVHRDAFGFYTRNLVPGARVYGERLVRSGGVEFRSWNPRRSKLGALLRVAERARRETRTPPPGPERVPWGRKLRCLYLGAASGTTVSHLSDVATDGAVVAVEKSPRAFRDLLQVAARRGNVLPVLGDAAKPASYSAWVPERVDLLYQDVAQREQAEMFVRNARAFLKPGGTGLLMLKARSVSVSRDPEEVYAEVEERLAEAGAVQGVWGLEPYDRDHAAFVVEAPR